MKSARRRYGLPRFVIDVLRANTFPLCFTFGSSPAYATNCFPPLNRKASPISETMTGDNSSPIPTMLSTRERSEDDTRSVPSSCSRCAHLRTASLASASAVCTERRSGKCSANRCCLRRSVRAMCERSEAVRRIRVDGCRSCSVSNRPAPCNKHRPMISASSRSVFLFRIVARVNCLVTIGLMRRNGMPRARHARARWRWYSAVASEPIEIFFWVIVSRNSSMRSGVLTIVYRSATIPEMRIRAPTNSALETSNAMMVILLW